MSIFIKYFNIIITKLFKSEEFQKHSLQPKKVKKLLCEEISCNLKSVLRKETKLPSEWGSSQALNGCLVR